MQASGHDFSRAETVYATLGGFSRWGASPPGPIIKAFSCDHNFLPARLKSCPDAAESNACLRHEVLGRTGTVEEIAALVHFLASREAWFIIGQCYYISGGRATYGHV